MKDDSAIYTGYSMMRVFTPGETILMKDIDFDDIKPGDIIVFPSKDAKQKNIIHRVISRTADEIVTQGDNNPGPDEPLRRGTAIRLATAKVCNDGKSEQISGGKAGLAQFKCNQRKRAVRQFISSIINPLVCFMFWRIRLRETHTFNQEIHYYHNGRLIARKCNDTIQFIPAWKKIFYKI